MLESFSRVCLFTAWTVARQAPLCPWGFFKARILECGCHALLLRDLLTKDQTDLLVFCIGRQILLPTESPGSSLVVMSETKASRTTSPRMDFSEAWLHQAVKGVSEARVNSSIHTAVGLSA